MKSSISFLLLDKVSEKITLKEDSPWSDDCIVCCPVDESMVGREENAMKPIYSSWAFPVMSVLQLSLIS